jgi:hypothetical protein
MAVAQRPSEFLAAHIFLALNAVINFYDLKHESSPLSVPKNIGDCMQSHNGSNGTPLDPPLLRLANIFNDEIRMDA